MTEKMKYSGVVNTYKDVWELQTLIKEHDELVERLSQLRKIIQIKEKELEKEE